MSNAMDSAIDDAATALESLILFGKSIVDDFLLSSPIQFVVSMIHQLMALAGIGPDLHPTTDQIALCFTATVMTLFNYYFLFGNRHVRRRQRLAEDLKMAAEKVHSLEEQLLSMAKEDLGDRVPGKEVRIFMDGAFDMMHYGHMNAFRQGKALGTHLIVGINSDESITKCKGKPVMNDQERITAVEGCKFVDQVVPGCPYVMNEKYLDYVIKKYRIDYVVHGDDPCVVDGKDVYEEAKKAGHFQSIPRTEGVSTTDIVGRMLLMTKDHHKSSYGSTSGLASSNSEMLGSQSKFLTTSRMLRMFSAGVVAPEKDMKIVYMDGSWDMFHAGHISILNKAKEMGDYLIVGVHSDMVVNAHHGSNLPIMNLHERVLSVLGCKFVDDVLIDAPYSITNSMIASLNISKVVRGTTANSSQEQENERYGEAKACGIFEKVTSDTDFSLNDIFERISANQQFFQRKIDKKKKSEESYYDDRYSKNENYKAPGKKKESTKAQ